MSLDLGGPAIEIAIALAFVFFLLSLIASHVTEWIAGLLNIRAKTLRQGLRGMLGDDGVAERILSHALVRTDLQPDRQRDPSYISPENFALAFRDVVEPDTQRQSREVMVDNEKRPIEHDLKIQLDALPGTELIPQVAVLEKWFDTSMDRVSGWYKRKSQLITIGVSILVVLILNVSALRIAEQLNDEPKVLANVVAKAEAAEEGAETSSMEAAGKEAEKAVDHLASLSLPVFWTDEKNRPDTTEEWLLAVAGWLISIAAISLGAPFWFDALNKLSNLRMAGKKPEGKSDK